MARRHPEVGQVRDLRLLGVAASSRWSSAPRWSLAGHDTIRRPSSRRIPAPPAPPELCEGGRVACSRGQVVFFLNDGGFLVPPGYLGVAKQAQGHLVIMAAPRRPDDPRPPSDRLGCYADHPVATATVHGTRAVLLRCPTGSALNSGHILVRWSQRGIDMAVSLHGWSELNLRLVLLLAAHAHLTSPRR